MRHRNIGLMIAVLAMSFLVACGNDKKESDPSETPGALAFADKASYDIPPTTVGATMTAIDVSDGVSGGTTPYTFSASGLPQGIAISGAGVISGTFTAAVDAGTATVTVTDSATPPASKEITINFGKVTSTGDDVIDNSAAAQYWNSGLKQERLYGKVKTVTDVRSLSIPVLSEDFWERNMSFDESGRLTEKVEYYAKSTSGDLEARSGAKYNVRDGNHYGYDAQGRLIQDTGMYYEKGEPEENTVWKFGYDASDGKVNHDVWLPADLFDRKNPRLQKGITSYWMGVTEGTEGYDEINPIDAKVVRNEAGKLVIDSDLGDVGEDMFGIDGSSLEINVDYAGNFPSYASAVAPDNREEKLLDYSVELDDQNMPKKLIDGNYVYSYQTTQDGFLVMTGKQYMVGDTVSSETRYEYDDKGNIVKATLYEDGSDTPYATYSFSYEEPDAYGNWTKWRNSAGKLIAERTITYW